MAKTPLTFLILSFSAGLFLLVIGLAAAAGEYNSQPSAQGGSSSGNVPAAVGTGEIEVCGNTDLSRFLSPPYGNISNMMICTPLWNTFVLRYWQSEENNVMTMVLSAVYTTGWVGIGFSKNGSMIGSSAMVGWINRKGHPRVKQYSLEGYNSSQVKPDRGDLPLVATAPPHVVVHGAMIYLAFQLKYDSPLRRQPLILAFGTRHPLLHHLTRHVDRTTTWFDFSRAQASGIGILGPDKEKRNHGVLGVIGWGLILPVGAIVARYFKHKDPLWYYLHGGIQLVGFVIGLAGVLLGLQLYKRIGAHFPSHKGIGVFLLVLSILQVLAFFLRPSKDSKIRTFWNWYHHWVGRLALFLGALNIVLGIHIGEAGNGWKIGYGFVVAFILIAVIVLEVLSYLKRSRKFSVPTSFRMDTV